MESSNFKACLFFSFFLIFTIEYQLASASSEITISNQYPDFNEEITIKCITTEINAVVGLIQIDDGQRVFESVSSDTIVFSMNGTETSQSTIGILCVIDPDPSIVITIISDFIILEENFYLPDFDGDGIHNLRDPVIDLSLTETLSISDSISFKPSTIYFTETVTISDSLSFTHIPVDHNTIPGPVLSNHPPTELTETLGISDNIHWSYTPISPSNCVAADPASIIAQLGSNGECVIFPIVQPEPVIEKSVQKSSGSSSGGGRTNVDVSSMDSRDSESNVSLDRISKWLATPEHFKVAVKTLIAQQYLDLEPSQIKDPPAWFYQVTQYWSNDEITNKEMFNALNHILK